VAEDHEVLEARWVPLDEAFDLAAGASLQDGKTIVGLAWARARLAR
jgi:hypothetical protein